MPPLNSWLEIQMRIPFLVFPLLLVVIVGLMVGGVLLYRRWQVGVRELRAQAEALRGRLRELEGRQEAWAAAEEAYRHFIYTVSHEVSNPLQSIQTNLDNMAGCGPEAVGRWQQYHGLIAAEAQRLRRLTENLRLLSHLETPDAPLVREPVNLKGVIEDVIMALSDMAEERKVRLRYVGPERPARVLGDRDQLRQVLLNLVDNGIKYSKPAGGQVVISVQEEGERLRVQVSDEGIGMAEEELVHIFDTAYRSRQAASFRRQGSGLGLAIVKRIVERHGGQVQVQSREGEGTTFAFDLPVYAAHAWGEGA